MNKDLGGRDVCTKTESTTRDYNGDMIKYVKFNKDLIIEVNGERLYVPRFTKLYKSEPKFIIF